MDSESELSSSDSIGFELRTGTLGYCYFVLRGVTKAAQVRVVEVGAQQTIVAAPGSCVAGALGGWAGANDCAQEHLFLCSCAGSSCSVAFHSVDTNAISEDSILGAAEFRSADDEVCQPLTRSLLATYHGAAQERSERMATCSGRCIPAESYHEVRLSEHSALFFSNSVILMPDLLTPAECGLLADACESQSLCADGSCGHAPSGPFMRRYCVCELDFEVQELNASMIHDRLLPFFEQQIPEVAKELFGRSSGLSDMTLKYHSLEPCINRYTHGGDYHRHTDDFNVTLLVSLSEPDSFVGGGTNFWPQGLTSAESDLAGPVLVQPRRGTGVIFNGNVEHSARVVERGIRHTYVASLTLGP
mmetsp:Transcript_1197/g.3361  ORF Transcript_1197/g.3361 Transcript_1197/m.3361 type:complete len:360 (+) Transcript_1197:38-1117(+)